MIDEFRVVLQFRRCAPSLGRLLAQVDEVDKVGENDMVSSHTFRHSLRRFLIVLVPVPIPDGRSRFAAKGIIAITNKT